MGQIAASSELTELAVSPADRGLRRCKTLKALWYKVSLHHGRMKQKVKKEIPLYFGPGPTIHRRRQYIERKTIGLRRHPRQKTVA